MLIGISRNKSLLLAALFLALALMVAPSASRNILAYPTGRMAVQQEGYTYGGKKPVLKMLLSVPYLVRLLIPVLVARKSLRIIQFN
jgi:hypothetical protein